MSDEPITVWIQALKQSDEEAARQLWDAYFPRLLRAAQRRLKGRRRVTDEEDVVVSVFDSLCRGAGEGRFVELHDRTDLWRLLLRIVGQKSVDQLRHEGRQKRGGGDVRGDSVFRRPGEQSPGFDQVAGGDVSPDFLALVEEENRRLLALLPEETLRSIATYRLEGYANEEIAERLGISLRSVERKLQLIRQQWSAELPS